MDEQDGKVRRSVIVAMLAARAPWDRVYGLGRRRLRRVPDERSRLIGRDFRIWPEVIAGLPSGRSRPTPKSTEPPPGAADAGSDADDSNDSYGPLRHCEDAAATRTAYVP